jgi:hypothetical protein
MPNLIIRLRLIELKLKRKLIWYYVTTQWEAELTCLASKELNRKFIGIEKIS